MIRGDNGKIIALAAVFGIAALTTGAMLSRKAPNSETGENSGSLYILGPARGLLAQSLYKRADIYFHKGAPYHKETAFDGLFQKWKRAIHPEEHAHTAGREVEEILPWLRLASQTDPSNIEIFMVASFWLNRECNRNDLAQQAIHEAMELNPDRYELLLELGRIQLSIDQFEPALESLNQALILGSNPDQKDPEQAAIDLPFIVVVQSFLHEVLGNKERAIAAVRFSLSLRPQPAMIERLEKLETQPLDPDTAKDHLQLLFHKPHSCDRDGDDHVHDEHCNHETEDEHIHDEDCSHDEHVHGPECNH